jgi:hypothetical protein
LGRYWAGLKDSLSPAAAALDKRLAGLGDVKMRRGMGGGGTGGASNAALKAVQAVEAAKGELIALQQRGGDPRQERAIRTRIDRAVGRLSAFPGQAQGGLDSQGYPWAKIWNGQQFVGIVPDSASSPGTQQPRAQMDFDLTGNSQQGPTDAEVQAYARRFNIPVEQARQELARQ